MKIRERIVVVSAAVCILVPVFAGCRPDKADLGRSAPVALASDSQDGAGDSPVVARIGDRTIRFDEVASALDALPVFVRMRYQAPERRLEFLEAYLEFQVLALAASAEGLGADPFVVDAIKRDMVSRYLRDKVDSRLRVADIPESEVAAWYEDHIHRYRHPAQNKVLRILVKDPVEAAKVAFRATELIREANGDPTAVFESLVKPPWVAAEGVLSVEDIGYYPDVSGLQPKVPVAVAEAASSMADLYSVIGPVPAEDGLSILFVAAKLPAAEVGIDQARTEIASIILEQRRLAARRALSDSLLAGREVKVDRDVLAGIAAEAAVSGSGPAKESR